MMTTEEQIANLQAQIEKLAQAVIMLADGQTGGARELARAVQSDVADEAQPQS